MIIPSLDEIQQMYDSQGWQLYDQTFELYTLYYTFFSNQNIFIRKFDVDKIHILTTAIIGDNEFNIVYAIKNEVRDSWEHLFDIRVDTRV